MSLPPLNGAQNSNGVPLPPPLIKAPVPVSSKTETNIKPETAPPVKVVNSFELNNDDVFEQEDTLFDNVSRTLIVNEQPFLRWLKRVSLAILVASIFVCVVTFAVQAPIELGLVVLASVWIVILAITAPEAIIPYKKTTFDLAEGTVKVGQKKPQPISNINSAYVTSSKKDIKLWLSFSSSKKDGFFVPIKSNKFSMKNEDLLALRTIIPHTSIDKHHGTQVDFAIKNKMLPVAQDSLLDLIESLLSTSKN